MAEFFQSLLNPYFITDAAGVTVSFIVLFFITKKVPLPRRVVYSVLICALIGLFLGCHIMYLIIHIPQIVNEARVNPIVSFGDLLVRIGDGASGLAYFGGLFGFIAVIALFCRIWKLNTRIYMNTLILLFPLYQCAGRIGCSLAGCCYGIEYYGIFAIHYDESYIVEGASEHIAEYPHFPVQPLESLLGLVLFFVLLALFFKFGNMLPLTCIYVPAYAFIRFFDEFLRADAIRGIWGPLSASQWIALGTLLFFAVYWYRAFKLRYKAI